MTITALNVLFDRPVRFDENKEYKLVSLIYGEDGDTSVECQGVRFTFRFSGVAVMKLTEKRRQFPRFSFS